MTPTLRDALSTRENALNFVRLVLAAVVIFEHTWIIGGYENAPDIPLASWAVNGFFAISGYLIAGSKMRLGFREYMVHRAFRIFPAYWAVLVLTAFAVAPLASFVGGGQWQLGSALSYVGNNFLLSVSQFGVGETLATAPYPDVWNGSIWTLFFEFVAYIAAGVLLTFAWVRRHALPIVAIGFVGIVAAQILAHGPLEVTTNLFLNLLRFGAFFAAGMLLYFLGPKLRLRNSFAAIAAVLMVLLFAFDLAIWVGQLPFAFLMLWAGGRLPVRIGVKNDVSYGLYIWAFPVQQFVILLGLGGLGPWGTAVLSLLITLALAWGSWKLIEEPTNGLRRKIPKSWLGPRPNNQELARPRPRGITPQS
ncbi:acyltransferase family protein [Pseudoclavibacter sp. 8L]|uniref:acyltransferase family protein n=1 Tax=Pseudoclavibacter sp. 8L TaxID=2653162 RepID=UPI0012EF5B88|nr:acyltransferase [Pseudoclavibacter sp. 8L]VXB03076.1 conserved membrane hypothetical protein [Pseudoclavibacter sp. 8L]